MRPLALSKTIALLTVVLLGGCAQHSYVMLADDANGRGGVMLGKEGEHRLDAPGKGMAIAGIGQPFAVSEMRRKADFDKALAAQPALPERFTLHLTSSGGLDGATGQLLDSVLLAARRRDYPVVTVIGHTDTLGHRAANEQVGLRRAQAVAELLRTKGLEAMELRVESHGERNPLVATPDATVEPRNRRVEVLVR
ncbi:OmpA family protein [Stutzerimonas stutzeri]|uniref:Membrane protein n=1 Tax=Stutzerimonas stutzeri KOS6 TaxID=1218352 RepID=A0A061JWH2_STUST|nr:OmpA family protein [Stutzerimonas stutzeri]EWC43180.1 membrane protein [Stutzerimonas stutzeri KOS6]